MSKLRQEAAYPDRPILAYKFHAQVVGDLPTWVTSHADMMRQAWNDLAFGLRRAVRELPADVEPLARNEALRPFRDIKPIREIVRSRCKGIIPSDLYENVLITKWQTAMSEWPKSRKRAREAGKPVTFETGMPRPRYDDQPMDTIQMAVVVNRTRDDMMCFDALYDDGAEGVRLLRTPDEHGANCYFRVRSAGRELLPVALRVAFHRLPPDDAFIKRITLSGRLDQFGRWQWTLIFTCQVKKRVLREQTGRVAGHNSIGWRLFEDRIRIGVIADNGGNFYEIAEPLVIAGRERRRESAYFTGLTGAYGKPLDHSSAEDLQGRLDARLEACKAALLQHYAEEQDQWPEHACQMMRGLTKMREGGLMRLQTALAGYSTAAEVTLCEWREDHAQMRRTLNVFQFRAMASKRDAYRKVAAWIARNFDEYAMTCGSLKGLAEADDQPYGIKLSQRQRQIVGQFYLRDWIGKQIAKYHPWRVSEDGKLHARAPLIVETAYRCECGAAVERNGKLLCVCANGHVRDQDVVAAAYVLNHLPGNASITASAVAVPPDLSRYLRVLTPSEVSIQVAAGQ